MRATASGEYTAQTQTGHENVIWVHFELNGNYPNNANHTAIIKTSYSTVKVSISKDNLNYTMAFFTSLNAKNSHPASTANRSGPSHPSLITASTSLGATDSVTSIHYKYPSGHEAMLVVSRMAVFALSIYSLPDIIAIIGTTVANDIKIIATADPASSELLLALAVDLAADYATLYAQAEYNHEPTIYLKIGFSWGTQWYNFWQLGVYGEEGLYTADYQYNSGLYMPLFSTGSLPYALEPYFGTWNPFAEPPRS